MTTCCILKLWFVDRIHKEQMEKCQEEIKELRVLDAANEEIDSVLQNAKYLFQNIHGG